MILQAGKLKKLLYCPECGWETAARTPRGRVAMLKKHAAATGHTKLVATTQRRPPDLPF